MSGLSVGDRSDSGSPPEGHAGPRIGPVGRLGIGAKLSLGFGALVSLTLIVIVFSYLASERATSSFSRTTDVLAPLALAADRAQANLLRMVGDVRGYLALGEERYRAGYDQARKRFEANLADLEVLADRGPLGAGAQGVKELRATYEEWSGWPERLFDLHDDQLQREPGLRLLLEEGNRPIAIIVVTINKMIASQRAREPTEANLGLLANLAGFTARLPRRSGGAVQALVPPAQLSPSQQATGALNHDARQRAVG